MAEKPVLRTSCPPNMAEMRRFGAWWKTYKKLHPKPVEEAKPRPKEKGSG